MKHLLACLAILAAFNVTAQVDGFQLPYNPDSEPDGYIGVNDILEVLSIFGSEFNLPVMNNDSTSAIVEAPFTNDQTLGANRSIHGCRAYCKSLPGNWRATTITDIEEHWEVIFPASSSTTVWVNDPSNQYEQRSMSLAPDVCDQPTTTCGRPGSVLNLASNVNPKCFCATHERPKVEYSICKNTVYQGPFEQCCSSKVAEGWYPLSTNPVSGGSSAEFGQAFWRWAD